MSFESAPALSDVILDVLVSTEARETLAGLTIELEHVDASLAVKGTRRMWIDVSGIQRGAAGQLSLVAEDVPYEDGDAFAVSVRSPIPVAERGEYQEFADLE